MALPDVFSLAAALVLLLAALPFARLRRLALALLTHTLRLTLFTAAAACSVLAVSPTIAPVELTASAAHLMSVAGMPLSPDHATVFWLGLGGLLLAGGLPLVAHLEYARRAAAVTSLFNSLERHASAALFAVRQSTGQTTATATGKVTFPEGDVAAGVAVLSAILNDRERRPPTTARPTLVKDVLMAQSR